MINIRIDDKYRVVSDPNQYILEKKRVNKKTGETRWLGILFFGTVKNMLNYLPEYFARQGEATSLTELAADIKSYHELLTSYRLDNDTPT